MDSFNDTWGTPPNLGEGLSPDQMDSLAELHENAFEPQIRARSNTWPLPRPENFVEPSDDNESNNQKTNNQQSSGEYYYHRQKKRKECIEHMTMMKKKVEISAL